MIRRDVCALLAVALAMAACLDPLPGPSAGGSSLSALASAGSVTGYWIFHLAGPAAVNEHVQLVQVTEVADSVWPLRFTVFPALDWAGNPTADLEAGQSVGRRVSCSPVEFPVDSLPACGKVEWLLAVAGTRGVLRYEIAGDAAHGAFVWPGDSASVDFFAVRVDTLVIPSPDSAPRASPSADSTPLVLLRVDDAAITDLDFLERVRQRSLVAELAIPTRLVSTSTTMNWADVKRWAALGFGVAAHSRWHRNPLTDQEFVSEIAGSLGDMAAHGLPTPVFAQPGTWHDSASLDGVNKLRNWRGSLVRSFTRFLESYVYNGSRMMPLADREAWGLGHVTISNGVPRDAVLKAWAMATQPRRVTVFLVHSRTVRPRDQLDWFLDSLAAARAAGRIRLVSSVRELWSP